MVSVGFVLFNLIGDNETGKADARLASRQAVAVNLVRDSARARRPDRARGRQDPRSRPRSARRRRAAPRAAAARAAPQRGREADRDRQPARAARRHRRPRTRSSRLPRARRPNGKRQGTVQVVGRSTRRPFARRVADVTGLEAAVRSAGASPAPRSRRSTPGSLPADRGHRDALGEPMRAASYDAPGVRRPARPRHGDGARVDRRGRSPPEPPADRPAAARLPDPRDHARAGSSRARCTGSSSASSSRAPDRRGRLLRARADTGRDDFAALGEEFNKMSGQLE